MDDAGRISQQDLINHLLPYGFYMCRHTPGLFKHRTRKIVFVTWVDDFLVKSNPATTDLKFLLDALRGEGIPEEILDEAQRTAPGEMYFVTAQRLYDAGVVTSVGP
jgi:hypothetical protein